MLTQKNEFILEASNFRFNCVDCHFSPPFPFPQSFAEKRLRAAWALVYLVAEDPHASKHRPHS